MGNDLSKLAPCRGTGDRSDGAAVLISPNLACRLGRWSNNEEFREETLLCKIQAPGDEPSQPVHSMTPGILVATNKNKWVSSPINQSNG